MSASRLVRAAQGQVINLLKQIETLCQHVSALQAELAEAKVNATTGDTLTSIVWPRVGLTPEQFTAMCETERQETARRALTAQS
jgi:hypothetical protein